MPAERYRGTYEVYIDVRHHKRHLDDWEERESTALKLVDTGDPHQMVLDALRGFADELEAKWAREAEQKAAEQRRADARAAWEERRGR